MNNGKHPILGYLKKESTNLTIIICILSWEDFLIRLFLNKNITLDSLAPQNTNFFYARV